MVLRYQEGIYRAILEGSLDPRAIGGRIQLEPMENKMDQETAKALFIKTAAMEMILKNVLQLLDADHPGFKDHLLKAVDKAGKSNKFVTSTENAQDLLLEIRHMIDSSK